MDRQIGRDRPQLLPGVQDINCPSAVVRYRHYILAGADDRLIHFISNAPAILSHIACAHSAIWPVLQNTAVQIRIGGSVLSGVAQNPCKLRSCEVTAAEVKCDQPHCNDYCHSRRHLQEQDPPPVPADPLVIGNGILLSFRISAAPAVSPPCVSCTAAAVSAG